MMWRQHAEHFWAHSRGSHKSYNLLRLRHYADDVVG